MPERTHETWSWCFLLIGLASLGALWSPGCGKTKTTEDLSVERNLRAIGVLYGHFSAQNRGASPKDEASFKAFLGTTTPQMLKTLEIESIEKLFQSARDNQVIVVRYGVPPGIPGQAKDVIAYESDGQRGKRFIVFAGGKMDEVDESQFKQLVPDAVGS